jgi:hypothetical protein
VTAAIIALSIVVHLTNAADIPGSVVRDAQAEVTAMFRNIGVDIEWSDAHATRGLDALRLTLLPYEPGALRLDRNMVLGAAMTTTRGVGKAWVFYRRVTAEADQHNVPVGRLLACAIAHELGHLLQGAPSHSDSGLMRAVWSRFDLRRAAQGRLSFTSTDVEQFTSFLTTRGIETTVR